MENKTLTQKDSSFKIPFINTSREFDLLVTFLLTPVWWVLGINFVIYQLMVYWVFLKFLVSVIKSQETVVIPRAFVWFGVFILSYAASILINIPNHSMQRLFASINNYSIYVMGFLLLVTVYHSRLEYFVRPLLKYSQILTVVTSLISVIFLCVWVTGNRHLEINSLITHLFPHLLRYPYFTITSVIQVTATDWVLGDFPRVSIYSHVWTATGGFMLILIPLMMAWYSWQQKSKIRFTAVFLFALIPLFFSVSRSAICAFIGAMVLVHIIERRDKILWAFLGSTITILSSGSILKFIEWLLNVRRLSTDTRMRIYEEAIRMVYEENLFLGIGVKFREQFTMTAIGSHSTYIGLLLVTGLMGLIFFVLFQWNIFIFWYQIRHRLNREGLIFWRYLGAAYIGLSAWLFTDNLETFPFIAYPYFIVIAFIFLLKRWYSIQIETPEFK